MSRTWLIILLVSIVGILIFLVIEWQRFSTPPPPAVQGEWGIFSLSPENNPTFISAQPKDSLLLTFQNQGWEVKPGRLNDYDPPWDSLRYLIGNIGCDTNKVEAYVEFTRDTNTTFYVLWLNSETSNDYSIYDQLTKKYFHCLEDALDDVHVYKQQVPSAGSR